MKRQTRQVYTVSFHLTLCCWGTYQRRWWASGFKLVGLAPPTLLPNHQHSPPTHTPFVSLHLLTSNCAGQLQMTPRLKSLTFDGGCVWCRQNKAQHLSFSNCSAAAVWSSRTVREVCSDQLLLPSSLGKKSILKNCGSKPEFIFSQRNGNILAKHFPAHTQIYLWMREFTQSDLQFIQSDSIISLGTFFVSFCVISLCSKIILCHKHSVWHKYDLNCAWVSFQERSFWEKTQFFFFI